MANETSNTLSKQKKSFDTDILYPYNTLNYCIGLVTKIVSKKGSLPSSKKEISIITELAEPSLVTRLSACKQYRLLNDSYAATELYQKISAPVFDNDVEIGKLTAFKSPPFFAQLIEEMNGKVLPSPDGFVNHLKSKFKMIPTSAERAAKIFLDNCKELGLIDNANRLKLLMPVAGGTDEGRNEKKDEFIQEDSDKSNDKMLLGSTSKEMFSYPIPLTENKLAVLHYPKGKLKPEDIEIFKMSIELLGATIGINKKKENEKAPQSQGDSQNGIE